MHEPLLSTFRSPRAGFISVKAGVSFSLSLLPWLVFPLLWAVLSYLRLLFSCVPLLQSVTFWHDSFCQPARLPLRKLVTIWPAFQLPHPLLFILKQPTCGFSSHNFHHLKNSYHETVSQTCHGDAYSLATGQTAILSRSSYSAWIEWGSPRTALRWSFILSFIKARSPIGPVLRAPITISVRNMGPLDQLCSPRA